MKLKKIAAIFLAAVLLSACGSEEPESLPEEIPAPEPAAVSAAEDVSAEEVPAEEEPVMTHEEFLMADMDSEVVVEGYISAVQQFSEEKLRF